MRSLFAGGVFALLGALITGTALADVEMTQRMEGAQEGTVVTRFKQEGGKLLKVRADQSPDVSLITDFKKKRVLALHHASKTAVVTKFRTLRKKTEKMAKGAAPVTVEQEEKVDGVDAVVYRGDLATAVGPAQATYWVAKSDLRHDLVVPLVQAYAESPVVQSTPGLAEALKELPGVILKSEVKVRDQSVITHLVSVTEREVADSVYEIPEGYRVEKQ